MEKDENGGFLFGEYIDSDKEIEMEKNMKKMKRNIKIDLDRNYYFNFLVGDLLKFCQVRKGINNIIENYEEKKDLKDDIYQTRLNLEIKPIIKKFDKKDIKVDDKYSLRENMNEEDIVPELYDDINEEEKDQIINGIATSLRSSIDKSINSSINSSIRQSYNQAYNQSEEGGIYDSLHGSLLKLSGGKGILSRLTQAFNNSIAEVPEDV